ncbi:MAG: hypothetical protein OEW15_17320 [Nitrospirota bacterium]|nr:hypothetical protein [Nitrospirota bacterium]
MSHLHQHIAARVDSWRASDFACNEYSAIAEVLEWAKETETGNLRFLRRPQLRALETYWYLRLIEKTPHIFDLYRNSYPKQSELLPPRMYKAFAASVKLTFTRDGEKDVPVIRGSSFNVVVTNTAPHRVILLVNKGTEGWNCPSLFACALARKLKTSNNFVLQAATRCLRQVPGNEAKARVYLSTDNFTILDKQLQETYGETIADLNHAGHESAAARIVLRKLDLPPLVVTQTIRTVARKEGETKPIRLERPKDGDAGSLRKKVYTVGEQLSTFGVLQQIGETVTITSSDTSLDPYTAATELSRSYRLDLRAVYDELKRLYANEDIPASHVTDLSRQVEEQTRFYEIREEKVDVALALVKPEGFNKETTTEGTEVSTADIIYPKDREHLLAHFSAWKEKAGSFGFRYDPYNFDSNPEKHFFEQMLAQLNVNPDEVEDIYFTGALTDPAKTDFFIEYKDDKGKWRRYTPDFVIRKKPKKGGKRGSGKVYTMEIKSERERSHPVDARRAGRLWRSGNGKS